MRKLLTLGLASLFLVVTGCQDTNTTGPLAGPNFHERADDDDDDDDDDGDGQAGLRLTRTVFEGTCQPNGAIDDDGVVKDGDVISDATITLADLPMIVAFEIEDPINNPDVLENFRDRLLVREGEITILCPSDMTEGEFFFPGNDYKIVMIK